MNKKIMSFKIQNTYTNARQIADRIIIGLMRFPNPLLLPYTYSSSVVRTIPDRLREEFLENHHVIDSDVRTYRIKIYRVSGNHGSILSPSQNEVFMNVVTNDDLVELMSKYVEEKGK